MPQNSKVDKASFIKNDLVVKLRSINPAEQPRWGLMNVQQMIEHMSDSFRQANGKIPYSIVTPAEHLEKAKSFMMSEKPFKENTKNVLLPATPAPVKFAEVNAALEELQVEINDFLKVFEKEPNKIITNPIFGHLNYTEWVQLLHKHATHHLHQFGVEI